MEVRPKWHLSFDCATKTFAFCVAKVDLDPDKIAKLRARVKATQALLARGELRAAAAATSALDAEVSDMVRFVDGDVADLVPGRKDDDIPFVERLRAVTRYVETRVRPALAAIPAGERRRVVIEFQGMNPRSQPVAAALVALFADEDVIIVGPALKNKVAACPEGQYCHFALRYRRAYDANKEHARFNFAKLETLFGSGIRPTSAALRGHIADSAMQVIGYLVHGPDEKSIAGFF